MLDCMCAECRPVPYTPADRWHSHSQSARTHNSPALPVPCFGLLPQRILKLTRDIVNAGKCLSGPLHKTLGSWNPPGYDRGDPKYDQPDWGDAVPRRRISSADDPSDDDDVKDEELGLKQFRHGNQRVGGLLPDCSPCW